MMQNRIIYEKSNPNDPRTEGELAILTMFQQSPKFEGWTIFEEPHINGMKPDFVAYHPKRGIIIIEVKDWDLSNPKYQQGGFVQVDGRKVNVSPIKQVQTHKRFLFEDELRETVEVAEEMNNQKYAAFIEPIIYFHCATAAQARQFLPNAQSVYVQVWGREHVEGIMYERNERAQDYPYALKGETYYSDAVGRLVRELDRLLRPSDYELSRMEPYQLDGKQERLAKLRNGSIRRWSGVAGAGKTLILAEKAVRAMKEGQRVLVVTFNITLQHYIRDLISQQFGQTNREILRDQLVIRHFHRLLKAFSIHFGIYVPDEESIEDWTGAYIQSNSKWIDENLERLRQDETYYFDTILIDEGQDFNGDWVRFLKKLYSGHGEFLVMYDQMQDIYDRGLWITNSEDIKQIGFRGTPGMLTTSYRLPKLIIEKIEIVKRYFHLVEEEKYPTIQAQQAEQLELFGGSCFTRTYAAEERGNVAQNVYRAYAYLERRGIAPEDITILTLQESIGLDILRYFRQVCPTLNIVHVYDESAQKSYNKRRKEKWKFQPGTGKLKISSYQSYKGWETPNVIIVLELENSLQQVDNIMKTVRDALLIGLSRVKMSQDHGQFHFICHNYLPEAREICEQIHDDY